MADEEQDQTNPDQPEPTEEPQPAEDAAPSSEPNAEEALEAASASVDDLAADAEEAENAEQANDILKAAMEAVKHATTDEPEAADNPDSAGAQASTAAAEANTGANTGADAGGGGGVGGGGASQFDLPDLDPNAAAVADESLDLLSDVNLNVKVELGRTRMLVEDVLRLADGAVVELDKLAGDPVDIYVNNRPIARGEVLVLNDNFCIRVNEIVSNDAIKREHVS